MKEIKVGNQILRFYTMEETFRKIYRSRKLREAHEEELARLKLAYQIRQLRTTKRLTQKTLAKKTNMPQSVIARMEGGKHSVTLGTLYRVAHAFGKEVQLR